MPRYLNCDTFSSDTLATIKPVTEIPLLLPQLRELVGKQYISNKLMHDFYGLTKSKGTFLGKI
jgi:hypothetical protein